MLPTQNERDEEIQRLREQVQRAEESGNFDTCHHEMLRRLTGQQPDKKRTAKQAEKEE